MRCKDCPYYWMDFGDDFPCCQYQGADGTAPCEED